MCLSTYHFLEIYKKVVNEYIREIYITPKGAKNDLSLSILF